MSKKEIIKLVTSLRNDLNLSLPINLHELAQKLKVNVVYETLNSEGYFINHNGDLYIFLNKDSKYPTRQRFTFAHEIGHRLLHIDSPILQRHTLGETRQVINYKKELKSLEDEANFFAAELLCPKSYVDEILPNESITMSLIEDIASTMDISLHAAAIKCVENSKTENELLMFFNSYQELKWFCSADSEFNYKMLPEQMEEIDDFLSEIYRKYSIETNTIENYGTLVLICGNKKYLWEHDDEY